MLLALSLSLISSFYLPSEYSLILPHSLTTFAADHCGGGIIPISG